MIREDMKQITRVALITGLFTGGLLSAQELNNVQEEIITTTTTVRDTTETAIIQEEIIRQEDDLELKPKEDSNKDYNYDVYPTLITRQINYKVKDNSNSYSFEKDANSEGYVMNETRSNGKKKEYARIQPLSDKYYSVSNKKNTYLGYFDESNNFVVERFDSQNGRMMKDTYEGSEDMKVNDSSNMSETREEMKEADGDIRQ